MATNNETISQESDFIHLPSAGFDGMLYGVQVVAVPKKTPHIPAHEETPTIQNALDDVNGRNIDDDEYVL